MNTNTTFTGMVIVALLLGACAPTSTPTSNIPVTGSESIGTISAQETLVESGPIDKLISVTKPEIFYNNSTVRVTNGGVAKLDFLVNQISILLFNDTAVDDVKADPAGTPDRAVRMKLVFGGLSGEVTKNGIPVKFEIANGVNVYVLGTQFLVLYDPETHTTYIGNFDGTIAFTIPGQSAQFTQAGQIYEISSNFEIRQSTLNFTRADIENLTSARRSTLLATLKGYLEPTATPTPTTTLTPSQTPSLTPSPTITLTPTKIIPCNKAVFVADVTIPDGTSFSPGFQFTKVWRLRNMGTCTWTNGYSLVFYRGEQMGGLTSINIPSTVAPGQTVDVAVNFVAPSLPGAYRGDWMLRSSSGTLFGAGANGTTPIWVKINVVVIAVTTPSVGSPDLTVSIASGPAATCDPKILTACITITMVGFVITNASNTDATSRFQVLIEATGKQSSTITVNGLAAGSSQNLVQDFQGSCFNPDCTARVTVDSSNTIPESNENNNVSEKTVTGNGISTITPTATRTATITATASRGAITGIMFADNSNGTGTPNAPDPGESIANKAVTLYDSTNQVILARTTTDANGKYIFSNLQAGTYNVRWINNCIEDVAAVSVSAGNTQTRNLPLNAIC